MLPLLDQPIGKVIITKNPNGKTCWLSQFTCQRHNEWYLCLGWHDSHIQRWAFKNKVMTGKNHVQEAYMAEPASFLQITRAHPPRTTGLSAPQPSSVPTCKSNSKGNELFRDLCYVSVCSRTEEYSWGFNPVTTKHKINLICILDSNIPVPCRHYHQIWLNESNPLPGRKHFLLKPSNRLGP